MPFKMKFGEQLTGDGIRNSSIPFGLLLIDWPRFGSALDVQ